MANAGFWQGMNQATQAAGKMGMDVFALKGQQEDRDISLGIARDRLAIEQEQKKRAESAFQYAEQERMKKDAENKAIVPASLVNPRIHEYPTQKAKLVEAAQAAGYKLREEGGELYGPKEAFTYMGSLVKSGNAESAEYIKAGRVDLQTKAQGLIQQIGELKQAEKTDEKSLQKIAGLEKQLLGVKTQIAQTFDIEDKVMEQSRINANKPDTKDHLRVVGHQVLDVSDPKNPKVVHTAPFAPTGAGKPMSITDIKSAYGMEMQGIKNRMMLDMTPDEQANIASMPPEQLLAYVMRGSKSLPKDKKDQYMNELKKTESYYGGLLNDAMGKKGATPRPEAPQAPPASGTPIVNPSSVPARKKIGASDKLPAVGTTKEVNGKRYKYMGNNKWEDA